MALRTVEWNDITLCLPPKRARRRDWKRAFSAFDKLLEDGEDTRQAFEVIEALSGPSLMNSFRKFLSRPEGRALFIRREEIAPILDDHARLAQLPEGSFGRAYLTFVLSEGLSAGGLVAESEKVDGYQPPDPKDDFAWYGRRIRDMHDLWHVLTGYGRDGLGELALLSFTYAQTGSVGAMFIAYMGARAERKHLGLKSAMNVIWRARRNGRSAAFLPAADLMALLEKPLDQVRDELRIPPPALYREVLPDYEARLNERGLMPA